MPTSTARRQIDLIDEQWKANHINALACWDFEDWLRFCVEAFERINRQDEGWRRSVFSGEQAYSAEAEAELLRLFHDWSVLCQNFLPALAHFEQRFGRIENAAEFRSCLAEAQGVLTDDVTFFDGPTIAPLRDSAIEAHRRGEVDDVGRPG